MTATAPRIAANGTAERRLDIGAAGISLEGYETLDISPVFSPTYQHDLTNFPWPFEDETFVGVRCSHVLEHLERKYLIPAMNEMWRILKPQGVAEIEVPVFPYWTAIADPTHVSFFVPQTFAYFCTMDSYRKAVRGSKIFENYHEYRQVYGIHEWVMDHALRDEMGSIVRVYMRKP